MNKINIGIIGIGYWGPNILRNFAKVPNVCVKYICDLNEDKFAGLKKLYPEAVFTKNIKDVLEDDSICAVAIATSVETHFELAEAAFNAGKHVFIEKPLTLKCSEAEKLIKISEQENKKLMVGHLLLYHPAVSYLKDYIDKGKLGEIRYIYSSRLNLGKVRSCENAFWSLAPHDLSVILHILGCEPESITAHGESYLRDGVEDVVFCNLKFPNNVMANIHTSWLDPNKIRKLTIVGTKKMVVFDDMESVEKIKIYDKSAASHENFGTYDEEYISVQSGDIVIPKITNREPLYDECKHFIDSIINDTEPLSNGYDGLRVLNVLETVENILKKERK